MQDVDMIGVTIGVGFPYEQLAPLAAACFTKHTGLPARILGPKEFISSQMSHPAALRLKLFDYVKSNRVVYFDADWFCLTDWGPNTLGDPSEAIACRDFILRDEWPRQHYDFESRGFLEEPDEVLAEHSWDMLRHDYIHEVQQFGAISLPCARWINSGFLIINRESHSIWLKHALDLYLGVVGHHDIYYEQPALVKAIECLDLPIRLLPRKFNVLAAYEAKWPSSAVGLHIKVKRHCQFITRVSSGLVTTPEQVEAYFQSNDDTI